VPAFSKAELGFSILFVELPLRRSLLRCCQCHGAFIAPLPTENNNILGQKCSLRHWKQISNLLILLVPTAVCRGKKATDRAVYAVGNLFPNSQQLYELILFL
jgi:hypothetical protein